jgi:trans-2,3-dihydro-3-hydroxyanthranilate isomerase
MRTERTYHHVDVFTTDPFGGNQLAVFTDARGLDTETMQRIAREMNFAETTFVLPPQNADNDFHVRIFTPTIEMPMAGHPTIGTAFALRHTRQFNGDALTFEEGVGPVPLRIEERDPGGLFITMQQPLPTFGPIFDQYNQLADLLGLDTAAFPKDYPVQVVTCGVPFLMVPVRDVDAVKRLQLRADLWALVFGSAWPDGIYVFSVERYSTTATARTRMFSVEFGIWEDAATGSAAGPLGCYMVHYGLAKSGEALRFEQGYEMGRPAQLHVTVQQDSYGISQVEVGGFSVYMGSGHLRV